MLNNFSKLVSYESLPRKPCFIIWARPQTTFIFKLRKKLNNKNLAESSLLFNQATQRADIQLLDCIFKKYFLFTDRSCYKKICLGIQLVIDSRARETAVGLSKGKSINYVTLVK